MIYLLHFNLYLIRHGESEINILPDHIGQSKEVLLTEKGKQQAKHLANRLKTIGIEKDTFVHPSNQILVSGMTRAQDTARIVIDECQLHEYTIREELNEYSAGDWLGKSRKETFTDTIKHSYHHSCFFGPPNGESFYDVQRRVVGLLHDDIFKSDYFKEANAKLKSLSRPHNVLVFTHGGPIRAFLQYVMGFDKNFANKVNIDNCSVTKLSFNETGWKLNYLNNTGEL